MENMDEPLKLYEQFNNVYNLIDNELQKNGQLTIDVILLDNNPSDVLNIISNYAPTSFEFLKNNNEIKNYFVAYLFKKKEYFENLSISNDKLGKLLSKDGAGQVQHPKSDSFYYSESDQEKYLDDILKRLIDCTNLYFNLYHNKNIPILLGDGTRLELQFLYENLLHILGITKSQVVNNTELMRALNIESDKIQRLSSIEILERIIKDIETNKDILCLQMKQRLSRYNEDSTNGKIVSTQIDDSTTSEMLPYDKIDLKTRAFMNSGPYGDVSVISGIADDKYFIRDDKDKPNDKRDIQQVRISKTNFDTLKKEKVTIDNGTGDEIQISRGDYVFNGYTKRHGDVRTLRSTQIGTSKRIIDAPDGTKRNNIGKFKAMFNGQSPIPVIGVENPDGGTVKIFTPEQQQEMFLSLYYDFSGKNGMNFESYIEILKEFTEIFRNELEQQALAKTDSGIIIPTNGGLKK